MKANVKRVLTQGKTRVVISTLVFLLASYSCVENQSTTTVIKSKPNVTTPNQQEQLTQELESVSLPKVDSRNLKGASRSNKYSSIGGVAYSRGFGAGDHGTYIQHNTESYDRINENVFKEVSDDPLSTFSIDVDRASYSNVRRFLSNNSLPYKDAVRIEELINYFDYTYPQPLNGDPFSVTLEMGECPWKPNHKLMMIGIKGKEMQTNQIPPANLVFFT